jgi:hypothetical protein
MIAFALIHVISSSQQGAQERTAEPSVAAAYYGIDDGRELATPEYYPSAKHRTATANARLNRTWLQRRTFNRTRRSMNFSAFGAGKTAHNPSWPYRPLLGANRFNATLMHRSAEYMNELAEMKKKAALARAGESGTLGTQSQTTTCCTEETAECMACRGHMPVVFYCRRHPLTPGCAEVRQRTTPKTRLTPTAAP